MKETAKESTTVKALKEDFGAVVAKKDEEIQRLKDLIRGLQPIAAKESTTVKALKEDFGAVVAKKDEEIQRLKDLIRGLQPIADQYKVLFAENRDLQHQFDVVMTINHDVQQMPCNMQSEKAAAESRVKELSMVVGQVTAENEALTLQNSHLVQQIEVQIAFHFCCVCTWNPTAWVFTSVYSTSLIVALFCY